jgi:N-acyl-D-aspartate/D-glutamate deacylase
MYPYVAGSSYALQLLPPAELAGGVDGLKRRLRDPSYRNSLLARLLDPNQDEAGWQSKVSLIGWESILIAGTGADSLKEFEGRTLAEAGREPGPFEVLVRLIEEDDGATAVILFQLSEDDLQTVFDNPRSMVGSDGIPRFEGRPHPRGFGAFPRVWDRLTKQRGWLNPPAAIAKMTSCAASVFGLKDRGVIRAGAVADLVLFEPGFCDRATFESPRAHATGMRDVWVAGTSIFRGGVPTGTRPGAVLVPG